MYIIRAQVYNWKTDRYEPMYFYDLCWSTQHADLFASKQGAENYIRVHRELLEEKDKFEKITYIKI